MSDATRQKLELVWTWGSRLLPVILALAALYLSATFVSKAEAKADYARLEQVDATLAAKVAAHDIAVAELRVELRGIGQTLDRLEKQNQAILERLPAARAGPAGR